MPQQTSGPRLAWVDATRAAAVIAVVAYHVVLWDVRFTPAVDPGVSAAWQALGRLLGAARMPVLLAASGLVVSHKVRAGFHRPTTVRSVVANLYLYGLWVLLYAVVVAVSTLAVDGGLPRLMAPRDVLRELVLPSTPLWYLLALAVDVALLTALARVRPVLVLVPLLLVGVGAHAVRAVGVLPQADLLLKIPELAVFFAVGVYGARALARLAEQASAGRLVLALLATGSVLVIVAAAPATWVDAALFVPAGCGYVMSVVLATALLQRSPRLIAPLVWLGRRTLPVYLLHPVLVSVLVVAHSRRGPGPTADLMARPVVAALYPVLATALVVAFCLVLHAGLRRLHGDALFALPARWRAAVAGAA